MSRQWVGGYILIIMNVTRTTMGEDVSDWLYEEDSESDSDTSDSEEEWHQVQDIKI